MASTFLKPTKIVATMLGLLTRELTLPNLVWQDPVGDFAGTFNDTISIRLPAFINARTRTLRAGSARTQDNLFERKVDLTLDTDIYLDVPITDEVLTLDIADFGAQVLNPMVSGISRTVEDELAAVIGGATYENSITAVKSTDDPYEIAVKARKYLNNAYVPYDGRVLVVGSDCEEWFLDSDRFIKANESGSTQTLREAVIGRVAGYTVVSSPAIDSDKAYAFHQTAYALSLRAPVVPAGAPYGASMAHNGFAMRLVRVFDPDAVEDRIVFDTWMGSAAVKDTGHYDADPDAGGKFVPVSDPANPITGHTLAWKNDTARLVRAVEITLT